MTESGNTVQELEAAAPAVTAGGADCDMGALFQLLQEREQAEKKQRQIMALRLPLTACTYAGWLLALILTDKAASAWTVILTFALVQSLAALLGAREKAAAPSGEMSFIADGKVKRRIESELNELSDWAVITLSLAVLTVFSVFKIDMKAQPKIRKQVVEITLVSPNDAVNRHELLPASETATDSAKQKGELNDTMGSATPKALTSPTKKTSETKRQPEENEKEPTKEALQAKESAKAVKQRPQQLIKTSTPKVAPSPAIDPQTQFKFQAPSGWKTTSYATDHNKTTPNIRPQAASLTQSQMLSEVSPASFIESIDNEGENDHIVQSGGRSENGSGQENSLRLYLRELNRRIRKHWMPPAGMEEMALIQFRINHDGSLASVSAASMNAAGAIPTQAAIQAVRKTFPFKALPPDFKAPYLEVRYTFNYRINEMKDIPFASADADGNN